MKKLQITIELDAEETARLLKAFNGLVQGILTPPIEPEVVDDISEAEESEEEEIHDCLNSVEIACVEDFDGSFQLVTCRICGNDVSEEYEEAHGQEDDDYEAWKEFQAEEGWWP